MWITNIVQRVEWWPKRL